MNKRFLCKEKTTNTTSTEMINKRINDYLLKKNKGEIIHHNNDGHKAVGLLFCSEMFMIVFVLIIERNKAQFKPSSTTL